MGLHADTYSKPSKLTVQTLQAEEAAEQGLSRSVSWDPHAANLSRRARSGGSTQGWSMQGYSAPSTSSMHADAPTTLQGNIGCWTASRDELQDWFGEASSEQQGTPQTLYGEFSLVDDSGGELSLVEESPFSSVDEHGLPIGSVKRAVDEACGLRGAAEAQGLFVSRRPPEVYGPQLSFLQSEMERDEYDDDDAASANDSKVIASSPVSTPVNSCSGGNAMASAQSGSAAGSSSYESQGPPTTCEAGLLMAKWINPPSNRRARATTNSCSTPASSRNSAPDRRPSTGARQRSLLGRLKNISPLRERPCGRTRITPGARQSDCLTPSASSSKAHPQQPARGTELSATRPKRQLNPFMAKLQTTAIDPQTAPGMAHGSSESGTSPYISVACVASIHTWAAMLCTGETRHAGVACRAASCSLLLAVLQLSLVAWTGVHSMFPSCGMHAHCPSGTYCDPFLPTGPRCKDCAHVLSWPGTNQSVCDSLQLSSGILDVASSRRTVTNVWQDMANPGKACAAHRYCLETDDMPANCDHIHFNVRTIQSSMAQLIWLCIAALLLAAPLRCGIEQGQIAEALLDHRLRSAVELNHQSGEARSPSKMTRFRWFGIHCVRLALRMRVFYVPWLSVGAASSMLVTRSAAAEDAALTLLVMAIIVMLPELFGWFFLKPYTLQVVEQTAAAEVGRMYGTSGEPAPWLYARATAYGCAISLLVLVCSMDWLMEHTAFIMHMPELPTRTCGGLINVVFGGLFPSFIPFLVITLCTVCQLGNVLHQWLNGRLPSPVPVLVDAAYELFYNLAVCFWGLTVVLIALAVVSTVLTTAIAVAIVMSLASTCAAAFLHAHRQHRWKGCLRKVRRWNKDRGHLPSDIRPSVDVYASSSWS